MSRSRLYASYPSFCMSASSPDLRFPQEVMNATVAEERIIAERNSELGLWAAFRGRNLIRFIIAGWPKIAQQFVGLSVFNTYVTYFCK